MIVYNHNDNNFYLSDNRRLSRVLLTDFTEDFREFIRRVMFELTDRNMLIGFDLKARLIGFRWRTFSGEILADSFSYNELREWIDKPDRFLNKFIYRME